MTSLIVLLSISWKEVLVVVVLILLLFGAKRIPELMKGLGSGVKEFKDAMKEDDKKEEDKKDKE